MSKAESTPRSIPSRIGVTTDLSREIGASSDDLTPEEVIGLTHEYLPNDKPERDVLVQVKSESNPRLNSVHNEGEVKNARTGESIDKLNEYRVRSILIGFNRKTGEVEIFRCNDDELNEAGIQVYDLEDIGLTPEELVRANEDPDSTWGISNRARRVIKKKTTRRVLSELVK